MHDQGVGVCFLGDAEGYNFTIDSKQAAVQTEGLEVVEGYSGGAELVAFPEISVAATTAAPLVIHREAFRNVFFRD